MYSQNTILSIGTDEIKEFLKTPVGLNQVKILSPSPTLLFLVLGYSHRPTDYD